MNAEKPGDRVIIFDTTLRDGEQAPGCSMTLEEKVRVARQLERLGVDVIEAGFPIASPGDFESVREVSRTVTRPTVAGLARCIDADIDRAGEALKEAARPRIHVFVGTSEIHRRFQLKKDRDQVLAMAVRGIQRARGWCRDVEFSPMDASRTEPDYLREVVQAAIEAGAGTINIPDTVGYAMPQQFGELIAMLRAEVPGIERAIISVHCHNDLGLAVANSLAAVRSGARQIECAVNGIGERAGNCALEEVVMALRTRADYFGVEVRIETRQLLNTSRLVSAVTGLTVQRNKAIVGDNAFAHESGIHQDGLLKEKSTFEIIRPEDVGVEHAHLVLGKHSGRHALRRRLEDLGIHVDDERLGRVFEEFKKLADKKKEIFDEDVRALVEEEMEEVPDLFKLVSFHVSSGSSVIPTATVRMRVGEREETDAATGDGPIDALFRAVDRLTGISCKLSEYGLRAVTGGTDALGEVSLQVNADQFVERGRAASTDIVEASVRAYVAAVNRLGKRMRNGGAPAPQRPAL